MPPTGKTTPLNVISPVIAKSLKKRYYNWKYLQYLDIVMNKLPGTIVLSIKRETKAVVIVTPAEGPSLLMEPFGK